MDIHIVSFSNETIRMAIVKFEITSINRIIFFSEAKKELSSKKKPTETFLPVFE